MTAQKAEIEMKADLDPSKGESWVNYPATAIRRLVRNFGIDKGVYVFDVCTSTCCNDVCM